jgi:hypothetical protein
MILLYFSVRENVLARNAPEPSFPTNNPVNSNNNYYYRSRPARLVRRRRRQGRRARLRLIVDGPANQSQRIIFIVITACSRIRQRITTAILLYNIRHRNNIIIMCQRWAALSRLGQVMGRKGRTVQ